MQGIRRTVPRSARRSNQPPPRTPSAAIENVRSTPTSVGFTPERYAPDFQSRAVATPAKDQATLPALRTGSEALSKPASQHSFSFSGAPLTTVRWLSVGGRKAVAAVGSGDGGSSCDQVAIHAVTADRGAVESRVVRELVHSGKVLTLAVSPREQLLFAGSSDGTVRGLNTEGWEDENETLQDLVRMPKHGGRYEAVTGLAPLSSSCVASVGANGALCVVDAEAQKALFRLEQCDAVGFRDAASVDPESGNEVLAAGASGEVSVWDTRTVGQTRRCAMALRHPARGAVACCVAADAMQPHFVLAGTRGGELAIWDRRGGEGMPLSRVALHDGAMWDAGVVASSKPGLLLSCGEDGDVWLMDFAAAASRGAVGSAAEAWCDSGEFWRAAVNQSDLRNVAGVSGLGVNSVDAHASADLFAYASDSGVVGFGSLYAS